eukprot:jgi/Tetstr1/433414/TSEL_022688.t1
MDGHFGLEGILNAEVVLGLDMPSDITQAIETSVIKKMCSAEPIVVNKKGAKQVTIRKWEPPIMFSSNYTPTWPSKMGDIPRRILVFKCPDIIRQRDTTLMDKLTAELANIACRIFHAYHDLRFRLGEADIAQHITDAMKQWSGDLQSVTSTVFRFLATPDDERVVKTPDNHFHDVQIIKSPGDAILRKDLVKWFKLCGQLVWLGSGCKAKSFYLEEVLGATLGEYAGKMLYTLLAEYRDGADGCTHVVCSLRNNMLAMVNELPDKKTHRELIS